jgi:GNAT superfamily N-acetyltransferase
MSLEIRIATSDDASAACAILRRSITECCVSDHHNDPAVLGAWLGNKTPEMVSSWFVSGTNHSIVAAEAGQLLGVALLTRAGKVALCYLAPEACGRGVGKALLAEIESQARLWSIKTLQLHSTSGAQGFFTAQGYLAEPGHVRSPYGVDTVFFWKQLNADASAPETKRKRFCNCNGDA